MWFALVLVLILLNIFFNQSQTPVEFCQHGALALIGLVHAFGEFIAFDEPRWLWWGFSTVKRGACACAARQDTKGSQGCEDSQPSLNPTMTFVCDFRHIFSRGADKKLNRLLDDFSATIFVPGLLTAAVDQWAFLAVADGFNARGVNTL